MQEEELFLEDNNMLVQFLEGVILFSPLTKKKL